MFQCVHDEIFPDLLKDTHTIKVNDQALMPLASVGFLRQVQVLCY